MNHTANSKEELIKILERENKELKDELLYFKSSMDNLLGRLESIIHNLDLNLRLARGTGDNNGE